MDNQIKSYVEAVNNELAIRITMLNRMCLECDPAVREKAVEVKDKAVEVMENVMRRIAELSQTEDSETMLENLQLVETKTDQLYSQARERIIALGGNLPKESVQEPVTEHKEENVIVPEDSKINQDTKKILNKWLQMNGEKE